MKTYQKVIIWILIIIALVLSVFFINKYTQKCSLGHQYNIETNLCFYPTIIGMSDCGSGMIYENGNCFYKREGFFTKNILTILIIVGISSAIGIILFVLYLRKKKLGEITDAIRIPIDWESEVKPAFEEHWARTHNITLVENIVPENTFIYTDREPFYERVSGRKFMQIEMQCYSAQNPDGNGVFTIIVPLDKEKKTDTKKAVWNDYRAKRVYYDKYKYPHNRPLAVASSNKDALRSLIALSDNPEEALKKLQAQQQIMQAFEPKEEVQQQSRMMPYPEEIESLDPYERVKLEEDMAQGKSFRRKPMQRRPFRR